MLITKNSEKIKKTFVLSLAYCYVFVFESACCLVTQQGLSLLCSEVHGTQPASASKTGCECKSTVFVVHEDFLLSLFKRSAICSVSHSGMD